MKIRESQSKHEIDSELPIVTADSIYTTMMVLGTVSLNHRDTPSPDCILGLGLGPGGPADGSTATSSRKVKQP